MVETGTERLVGRADRLLPCLLGIIGVLVAVAGTPQGWAGMVACGVALVGLLRGRPWGRWLAGTLAAVLGAYQVHLLAAALVSVIAPEKPTHIEFHLVRLALGIILCAALLILLAFVGLNGRHLRRRN
jgi:hypothetical protein